MTTYGIRQQAGHDSPACMEPHQLLDALIQPDTVWRPAGPRRTPHTQPQRRRAACPGHAPPARDAHERATTDRATAGIQLDLGRLDAAESFATSAVRTYGEGHGRGRTGAELLIAEVYVRAGEPRGLALARRAINAVSTLQSVAVRQERLLPLAAALEVRPGSDARELARTARQIVATRMWSGAAERGSHSAIPERGPVISSQHLHEVRPLPPLDGSAPQ